MKCYVCVYRQPVLKGHKWQRSWDEAGKKRGLRKYLKLYRLGIEQDDVCYYDWGDDPAFFAAEEFLGNINRASWGVCRRDVREKLSAGDFVIFFCAKARDERIWEYYYIGLGTVSETIDRSLVWSSAKYKPYRDFFNLLVDSKGRQKEFIYDKHNNDWPERAQAPYILFDTSKNRTHFNLVNPLHVATYQIEDLPWRGNVIERWHLDDENVQAIYNTIPERKGGKRLRIGTTAMGYPHKFQNISSISNRELKQKRRRLLKISKRIASSQQTIFSAVGVQPQMIPF